jgi:hypothetical protein
MRSFNEACVTSGAVCLLALTKTTNKSQIALEQFLLTGRNDVDTGDGIFSIRGTVAIVYSRLAGEKSIPTLQKALKRNDPAQPSSAGSFPANYEFPVGTSHKMIQAAIDQAEKN